MADLSSITTLLIKFWKWRRCPSASPSVDVASSSSSVLSELINLRKLQMMVARIEAALDDAEKREIQDESVRLWLKDLRAVAYEAEEVLDEHEYELLRTKAEPIPCPPSKRSYGEVSNEITTPDLNASFWLKVEGKVRKIQETIEEISKLRDALHLREGDGQRRPQNVEMRPPTSYILDTPNPQGREDDLKKVTGMLLSDECMRSDLVVIPIVGIGGVGKTTLAQLVYDNSEVCRRFHFRGWISVSNDFDSVALTRKICEVFTKAEQRFSELSALQEIIIHKIKGKRFLLILDDVWSENSEFWSRLLLPLKHGKQGSAVMTTTRSLNVARIMAPVHTHYYLKCLSAVDCWEVLKQRALHGLEFHKDYCMLLGIGKEIAKKCKGLPLAAKSLGLLLSHDYDAERWKAVLESDIWDVDDKIIPALMVSYVHLPRHLKQCFLYASLFPKDTLFSKDELERLWMAQGFSLRGIAEDLKLWAAGTSTNC